MISNIDKLRDFRSFLYLVWKHLNLPDPTPVQYDISNYLQDFTKRRKVIEAFRGVGKSWITSAYTVWRLLFNPQLNFLVVSASSDRSNSFSTFTKRLITEIPVLQHLAPKNNQRQSNIAFDVAPAEADHAPSVKSVGIFGQLTGSRADEIIADDIEVPNNSLTQTLRDKLSEAVKEFEAILKPGGFITYLGTPQSEMSLYNLLPERGYDIRIWPARYPDFKTYSTNIAYLAPSIKAALESNPQLVGKPVDEKRFNDIELREREASYGRSGFSLQFMLDTSLSDANKYPLKLSDLIVMNLDKENAPEKILWSPTPERILNDLPTVGLSGDKFYRQSYEADKWLPYQGAVMFIDPAGRGKDETAWAIVKQLNGMLFLLSCTGVRGGYTEDNLQLLANAAKEFKVNLIRIESNFGDGMFTELLKPYLTKTYPCNIEEVRNSIQKEKRIIDTLEPVMNQHRLIVDKKVIEEDAKVLHSDREESCHYMLFYQMTRITRDRGCLRHDDRLDALAGAVAYWVEVMAQDVDKQIELRKDEEIQKELQVFLGNAKGDVSTLLVTPREGSYDVKSDFNIVTGGSVEETWLSSF